MAAIRPLTAMLGDEDIEVRIASVSVARSAPRETGDDDEAVGAAVRSLIGLLEVSAAQCPVYSREHAGVHRLREAGRRRRTGGPSPTGPRNGAARGREHNAGRHEGGNRRSHRTCCATPRPRSSPALAGANLAAAAGRLRLDGRPTEGDRRDPAG